ncbi:uncharacterized protein LOC129228144 [Uloborus diversus]|uniref:uncharacterized protein LOC129228144 n=1 Tax=Uloborus diversus TaxID=327109 RepID=UPI002409EC2F|nr:uncharacterized protein LOC129228144 [Uloborus diversus]
MPDILENPDESTELVGATAEDDRQAELLLAGFRACAREAIRFLLEEEGLSPDHPLPSGLQQHLAKRQCHLADVLHNDSGVEVFEDSWAFSTTAEIDTHSEDSGDVHHSDELNDTTTSSESTP